MTNGVIGLATVAPIVARGADVRRVAAEATANARGWGTTGKGAVASARESDVTPMDDGSGREAASQRGALAGVLEHSGTVLRHTAARSGAKRA